MERYFYAEQPNNSPLTIVDGMIDICDSLQPYIVVENNTELEITLQNGDKLAEISPIEQEMTLDELEEQAKEQEAQFATHLNQIGQNAAQLIAEECQAKLAEFLSFTSP